MEGEQNFDRQKANPEKEKAIPTEKRLADIIKYAQNYRKFTPEQRIAESFYWQDYIYSEIHHDGYDSPDDFFNSELARYLLEQGRTDVLAKMLHGFRNIEESIALHLLRSSYAEEVDRHPENFIWGDFFKAALAYKLAPSEFFKIKDALPERFGELPDDEKEKIIYENCKKHGIEWVGKHYPLKEIFAKHPELSQKVEMLEQGLISIADFKGFAHNTHPDNIISLLKHGITTNAEIKPKSGWNKKNYDLQRDRKKLHFYKFNGGRSWRPYDWEDAGDLTILFDPELQEEFDRIKAEGGKVERECMDSNYVPEMVASASERKDITVSTDKLRAIIVRTGYDRNNQNGFRISYWRGIREIQNILFKNFENNSIRKLVPAYDIEGNVVWPIEKEADKKVETRSLYDRKT